MPDIDLTNLTRPQLFSCLQHMIEARDVFSESDPPLADFYNDIAIMLSDEKDARAEINAMYDALGSPILGIERPGE